MQTQAAQHYKHAEQAGYSDIYLKQACRLKIGLSTDGHTVASLDSKETFDTNDPV